MILKNDLTADGYREITKTAELKKVLRKHKITLDDLHRYGYVNHDGMLCMGKHKGIYDYEICELEVVN